MEFQVQVGDRVRILNLSGFNSAVSIGDIATIFKISKEEVLLKFDFDSLHLHNGGGNLDSNCGWWIWNIDHWLSRRWLELVTNEDQFQFENKNSFDNLL